MSAVALPDSLVDQLGNARGQRNLIAPASPAAGANYTLQLDSRYVWRFVSVTCKLTAANAGTARQVVLEYLDGGGVAFDLMGASTTLAINTAGRFFFHPDQGWSDFTIDDAALAPLHQSFLPGGYSLRLRVVNLDAADQLSVIRLYCEQYWTDEAR